jgi:hypothetical protein
MESRHVIDKRQVRLEDIMKEDYIPFMEGRPRRESVITRDDVADLKIALNTTATFDEFLERV